MKTYRLINLDPEFWQEVRIECIKQDISVRQLILSLLVQWLKGVKEGKQ